MFLSKISGVGGVMKVTVQALDGTILLTLIQADGVASKRAQDAVPVMIAEVRRQSVPLRVEGIGNIEPMTAVSVKSRVDGQILKASVGDGAQVSVGQIMFEIDSRPLVAQLKQAEANLARDLASLERSRSQDTRYQDLLKKNFVSPENYSQIKASLESASATVDADRAAVENARLLVEYATIRSPINGRLGKIMIPQGSLVKANDTTALVVINQLSPIYVNFAIPEPSLHPHSGWPSDREPRQTPCCAAIGWCRSPAWTPRVRNRPR